MPRTKGAKTISEEMRLEMCAIIAPRLKFRDTNEELLLRLEDRGYEVKNNTLVELKKQLREGLKDRFKQIGEYELAEEHDFAIQMMKHLIINLQKDLNTCENNGEKVRVSAEIRAIQKDMIDYYGSTDIVESVFRYFNEDKEENKGAKVEEIKKEIKKKPQKKKKKPINKPLAKTMMTTF